MFSPSISVIAVALLSLSPTSAAPTSSPPDHELGVIRRDGQRLRGRKPLQPFDLSARGTLSAKVPLTNHNDTLWTGEISIGTPPQSFSCQFDTGSSDIIIPDTDCKGCDVTSSEFSESASSTFVSTTKPFTIEYVSLETGTGFVGYDTVAVAGLSVPSQAIGPLSTSNLSHTDTCVFGLSSGASTETNSTTWFENLVKSDKLALNAFSFYSTRGQKEGSELCIGCIDSTKYTGTLEYYPVDVSSTGGVFRAWNIVSAGISVGGVIPTSSVEATIPAIIDTGTAEILIPKAIGSSLGSVLPAFTETPQDDGTTLYGAPCKSFDSLPPIGLVFGSTTYIINPKDLNFGPDATGSTHCTATFIGVDAPYMTVGDVFLKNVYAVYDVGNLSIGFARSITA